MKIIRFDQFVNEQDSPNKDICDALNKFSPPTSKVWDTYTDATEDSRYNTIHRVVRMNGVKDHNDTKSVIEDLEEFVKGQPWKDRVRSCSAEVGDKQWVELVIKLK